MPPGHTISAWVLWYQVCIVENGFMWLAICSKRDCRWDHVASSQISAELYAHSHYIDRFLEWDHRVFVVEVPDEPPPSQEGLLTGPDAL